MAAECSPGREPGDQVPIKFPARLAGDRKWYGTACGSKRVLRHTLPARYPDESGFCTCRPFGAHEFFFYRFPRAYARGYTLPLADASSLTRFILESTLETSN
jgi:hypothetical protein